MNLRKFKPKINKRVSVSDSRAGKEYFDGEKDLSKSNTDGRSGGAKSCNCNSIRINTGKISC